MIYRWANEEQTAIQAIHDSGHVAVIEPGQAAWDQINHSIVEVPAPIVTPAEPVTADMVKEEAARRILAILPEWKQRNLTARAAELAAILAERSWTTEERAEWDAGQAVWNQIKAIRAASDALEAMDPIPQDYTAEEHWQGPQEA